MTYSVDTSALIEAWVRNQPPDVFPSVWLELDKLIAAGHFFGCGPSLA